MQLDLMIESEIQLPLTIYEIGRTSPSLGEHVEGPRETPEGVNGSLIKLFCKNRLIF
jgi:hypothetical protein